LLTAPAIARQADCTTVQSQLPKHFISNIKDTGADTLATNSDKQRKANNSLMLKRLNLSLMSLKMMSLGMTIKH
jgi:hypothetical protein